MKRPVPTPVHFAAFDVDEVTDVGTSPRTAAAKPSTQQPADAHAGTLEAAHGSRARTHPEVRLPEDHTEIAAGVADETSTSQSAIRIQRFRMARTDPQNGRVAAAVDVAAARARLAGVEKLLRDMQARVGQMDSPDTRGLNADLALALHDLDAVREVLRALDEASGRT